MTRFARTEKLQRLCSHRFNLRQQMIIGSTSLHVFAPTSTQPPSLTVVVSSPTPPHRHSHGRRLTTSRRGGVGVHRSRAAAGLRDVRASPRGQGPRRRWRGFARQLRLYRRSRRSAMSTRQLQRHGIRPNTATTRDPPEFPRRDLRRKKTTKGMPRPARTMKYHVCTSASTLHAASISD